MRFAVTGGTPRQARQTPSTISHFTLCQPPLARSTCAGIDLPPKVEGSGFERQPRRDGGIGLEFTLRLRELHDPA
eukprot:3076564-Rhodomonas_salina.1